ncbi:aminotransferase class V-fold PLP-dependent enzyme [Mobilitalea sibirica]|uniref:Aminotransferase class V-fold PLP-dependent enzyme n=1 Tax=Mobilitalea sibirica TaxID=1462919 RepID=A0A8J7H3R9_9FIRM|nr:aminotransferase class I/II-fold pyridoxal phosphate-dependent enzyme [Mobilitalea sibirica]MBH1941837.1 aminotransferase class V-fold PLP-dependent enzyme [Mobilitalea sibirica]
MYSFVNDYSEGAHPRILKLLMENSYEQNTGYGDDVYSKRAKEYIKKHLNRENVDIHFIPGGTQTNLIVISAFLRPHECVIAADTGHINVHETGAIEATGHKVVAVPATGGKLTPADIQKALDYHKDEHMVKPKMVYISNSTELGTIYKKAELEAIHDICKMNNLLLFLDGARLASALTCERNDLAIQDMARLVDVFYIGGTKNGALLGEALVICKDELKEDFRYLIKQRGAMLAKGFVIGMQFEALFQDDLYFELGSHANKMAEKLAKALIECGYTFFAPTCTNQLFPIIPDEILNKLTDHFQFIVMEKADNNSSIVRLVTSWATTEDSVAAFCEFLKSIS